MDGTLNAIIPGMHNRHIDELDFQKAPVKQKRYLFKKLRPNGLDKFAHANQIAKENMPKGQKQMEEGAEYY